MQALGSEFELDFLNLSYTRSAADVVEARAFLDSLGLHGTKILAKIETRQALLSFQVGFQMANLPAMCGPHVRAQVARRWALPGWPHGSRQSPLQLH